MISVRNNLHIRVLYTASQIWERTWRALMNPYRPEQRYMRGPGRKYVLSTERTAKKFLCGTKYLPRHLIAI